MAAWDTTPPPLRASDSDRDRVIRVLKDGSVEGRLSYDTFVRRVDLALRARDSSELAGLLRDLPSGRRSPFVARVIGWWSTLTAQVQGAWRSPHLPRLVLPRADRTVFTIGRALDCDLALDDMTVSWRHAEMRRTEDEWVLADLGSTNGTRVNGWRVGTGFTVRPGDCVTFGAVRFRLTDRP